MAQPSPPESPLRIGRLLLPLLAVALIVGGWVLWSSRNDSASEQQVVFDNLDPKVTAVDASDTDLQVSILWPRAEPSSVDLRVDGEAVPASILQSWELNHPREIVFVVDPDPEITSSTTGSKYADEFAALAPTLDGLRGLSVGVIVADESATVGSRLVPVNRRSSAAAARAVADIDPNPTRDFVRALERAAAMFEADPVAPWLPDEDEIALAEDTTITRTVVVLSGRSQGRLTFPQSVLASLTQVGAQVLVVPTEADAALARLAVQTGGAVLPSDTALADATALASYRQVVTATLPLGSNERRDAIVVLDGQQLAFSYPERVRTSNPLQLEARVLGDPTEPGIFSNPAVLYGSVGLAFLSAMIVVWLMVSSFYGESSLDSLLARYGGEGEELEEEEVQDLIVQTALLKRAVEATENLANQRGVLGKAEVILERANVPMRAGEAVVLALFTALVVGGSVFLLTANIVFALVTFALIPLIGFYTLKFLAARRYAQFQEQLPDALTLLAGTLRAGYSLPQGFDAVSKEVADPMGVELSRAMTEAQLGRPIEIALDNMAKRMQSEDFGWVVMALSIQREVGGNLAEILVSVAETMIQRERLRREVQALTAEGRVSALMLSAMPPILGVVMFVINPDYISILFTETLGNILLGAGLVSAVVGLLWMQKVIKIEA